MPNKQFTLRSVLIVMAIVCVFDRPTSTGYHGAVLYFEHEGWRITVNAMYVK